MSKISRGQKGEEKVIAILNKIKEYHHLLNNVTLINKKSEMTHQIDHILIHPHGIFVIETGKCPWCNSEILSIKNESRCSKCKFKFRL